MNERHERRPSIAALVPAAGSGERLGRGPKAFVALGGRTLLERAIEAFRGHADEIIVAVAASDLERARSLAGDSARVVEGGATRQDSVRRLLAATSAELVLVHDAARPFLPRDVIERSVDAARRYGAATVAVAVADSLVTTRGEVVDRSALRAVQTPQSFRREVLIEAHDAASRERLLATDDAALVRRLGRDVALVDGSAWLLKITTPADLELATALCEAWDSRARPVGA